MSLKKILIICLMLSVIFGCFVYGKNFFGSQNQEKTLKEKVEAHCNSYKDTWNLRYVRSIDENKVIEVFLKKLEEKERNQISTSPSICSEITDYLFSDEFAFQSNDYLINFHFEYGSGAFYEVNEVKPGMKHIFLRIPANDASLKELAEWYPDTEKYEELGFFKDFQVEDFVYFKNLRFIKLARTITEEQKSIIMSILPEVELDATISELEQ